jgi:DNA (cytosine-5)-methyltransferase 1
MRHGSLFSGIGGFDLAARWMGWDNVFHVEWNPWCRKVLEYHFPNSQSFTDVKQFDGSAWRGRVDIISGGFPCQPYSAAGKRLGKDDERHLWPEMLRIIREVAPTYVVGENVRGLTNWNGGVVFEEVCADLEAAGYEVWTGILPAAGVGAPHRRDRVWFVAHANGGADVRTPGRHAGTSTGEGIPERHEVRIPDQSGDVWDAADTACAIGKRTRDARPGWDGFTDNGGDGHAADTDGGRSISRRKDVQSEQSDGHGPVSKGRKRNAADTDRIGFEERIIAAESGEPRFGAGHGGADAANAERDGLEHSTQPGSITGSKGATRERIAGHAATACWTGFPTESPVCGGNDGISRELDGITFSKWRNESIKAYGNAIVPQVAYQIFKAIQQTHEN